MELFEHLKVEASGEPDAGKAHMAHDELLLGRAACGGFPVYRDYLWEQESVTFGYFQSQREIEAAFPGLPLTRRWTGGGAVLHGDEREFTYALAVPRALAFARLRAAEVYLGLHEAVARALLSLGVEVRLLGEEASDPGQACFQSPVPGDVILASSGQKVAGAAQRRTREGLLIQGSVRLEQKVPPQLGETLARMLGRNRLPLSQTSSVEIRDLAEAKYGAKEWLEKS